MEPADRPLLGRRVIVGRERPGELGRLLEARGAQVVHVPLIATADPTEEESSAGLTQALRMLDQFDWLAVTSVAGADRVGAAAAGAPDVRLAAVGSATARRLAELAGRQVDLVPASQRAEAMGAEMVAAMSEPSRVLVAVADRAGDDLPDALRSAGHRVTRVVAYRTVLTPPDPETVPPADALLLTSGSAADSWTSTMPSTRTPRFVVAIGPSTAREAERCGLNVTSTAREQSVNGLVTALVEAVLADRP